MVTTYRVAWLMPTNFGNELENIEVFTSLAKANKEFNKRLIILKKEDKNKETEEDSGLILENINTSQRIKSRIVDADGLQNYDGQW